MLDINGFYMYMLYVHGSINKYSLERSTIEFYRTCVLQLHWQEEVNFNIQSGFYQTSGIEKIV